MKNIFSTTAKRLLAQLFILALGFQLLASDPDAPVLVANQFSTPPDIDGYADDMWEPLAWHSLNYVWMDWGSTVDSADYYGRFKVAWSEETDLLYFFVEITDDVLVERYAEMQQTNHYNDIVEIFLDENNSGGMHIFDAGGTNAENAFSYHLTPLDVPTEGYPVTDFTVSDIAGTNWGDAYNPLYIDHFPEAILRREGNLYFWEFSLIVYTDAFEPGASEGTEAELFLDKEMGMALAYCETDNPSVYLREMFFGSYPGNPNKLSNADGGANYGYNDAWQNADDYNLLRLEEELVVDGVALNGVEVFRNVHVYGESGTGEISIRYKHTFTGDVDLELFDITGRKVHSSRVSKQSETLQETISLPGRTGVFILKATQGGTALVERVLMR